MKIFTLKKESTNSKTWLSRLKNAWRVWKERRINRKLVKKFIQSFHVQPDIVKYDNARHTFTVRWENKRTEEYFHAVLGTGVLRTSPYEPHVMVIWAGGYNDMFSSRLQPYPFTTFQEYQEFVAEANMVINSFKDVIS